MSLPIAAVIIASSNTGSACVDELLTKYAGSVIVRAVYRSEERAAAFRAKYEGNPHFQAVVGVDASDVATLPQAFEGAAVAYIVTPFEHGKGFGDDSDLNANMISAAVAAGVKHIVFGGSWTVHSASKVPDIAGRFLGAEALLRGLGDEGKVSWTFIRGGWYAANTAGMFSGPIKASGTIMLPAEVSVPPIDTDDIGRSAAAVCAVLGVGHEGMAYEMSGPELVNGAAFAEILSRVLGRPITHTAPPAAAFIARLPKFHADLFSWLVEAGSAAVPLSTDVLTLTGQHTGYEAWAIKHKALFE